MPHSSIVHDLRSAHSADALLTGAPLPTLLYFALPIILGNIFQQLYSIVDAIVVGNFLGDLPRTEAPMNTAILTRWSSAAPSAWASCAPITAVPARASVCAA